MKKRDNSTTTIGLDLGDRYSHFCLLNAAGLIVTEGRLPTNAASFQRQFGAWQQARVAIEAGSHSPWVSRLLAGCGYEVIVANPRRLRLIYLNDKKTDRVDAEALARVARLDPHLLAPIQHRTEKAQADLASLRARQALVRARTQLVNHVRGSVKAFGARPPKCSTLSFHKKALDGMPEELRPALAHTVRVLAQLTDEIRACDRQLQKMTGRYPDIQRLRQVPGVGPITALTYLLTIEDPRRFPRSRMLGSYLGLRPRQRASGKQEPQLRITKAGNSDLRRLLVGCAHYILGPFGSDCDLRRWGLALAARGDKSAKKRAIVAVARKLAVLLHRLWLTGDVYVPLAAERTPAIAAMR